jgi:Tfp pilus assembly protein PilN
MVHDLSFWEGPDWRRESTFSPNFLMGAILCLFAVVALGVTSYQFTTKLRLKGRLAALEGDNKRVVQRAERIRALKSKIEMWDGHMAALQKREDGRIVWSRQFEALWSLVPDDLVFNQLALNSTETTEEVEKKVGGRTAKIKIPKVRYTLTITGMARGEDAQRTITTFSDRLPLHPVIARHLESRELKQISDAREGGDRKSFTIMCTYKPLE